MKKCPQCGTQYSDVTLSFCLQDGTPLVVEPAADTPTVVLGETATRVRVPVGGEESDPWGKSQATQVAPPRPAKKGNTALAVGLTAVGMLVLFGIIGLAAFLLLRNSRQTATNIVPNTNITKPNLNYNSDPSPYVATSPMVKASPAQTVAPPPERTPAPPPPALASYPSTKRLVFGRGAYSTSFSGEVNPGDTRSLVLGCRYGQSLSATVSSGGDCVTIRGGGTSLRTTTNSGDNYVTLTNRCSSVAHFTVSISVI